MLTKRTMPALLAPAILGLGLAGAATPALAQERGQPQQQAQGQDATGQDELGSAYRRYLRRMHAEMEGVQRQGANRPDELGSAYRRYLRRMHAEVDQGERFGGELRASGEESVREQFLRGYRAGREEERRRREAGRQGRGGDQQGGHQQGGHDYRSYGQTGHMQGGGQDRGMQRQDARGSDPRTERFFVIPNVYPDSAPFQQFAMVPDYSRSMDHLLVAAQSLREAIQDLAQQPASERRNQAIGQMQDALLETQHAMMRIPAGMR